MRILPGEFGKLVQNKHLKVKILFFFHHSKLGVDVINAV